MMGKNIKSVDESIREQIIQDYQNCKSISREEKESKILILFSL